MKDSDLHRYFDGEVGPEEHARIESELTSSPAAREKLAALGDLQQILRETLQTRAEATPLNLWSGIAAKLEERRSFLKWLGDSLGEESRARWALPVAAAAAVMMLVIGLGYLGGGGDGDPAATRQRAGQRAVAFAAMVEIEEIETSMGAPTVIMTAAAPGQSSIPVVWIGEL